MSTLGDEVGGEADASQSEHVASRITSVLSLLATVVSLAGLATLSGNTVAQVAYTVAIVAATTAVILLARDKLIHGFNDVFLLRSEPELRRRGLKHLSVQELKVLRRGLFCEMEELQGRRDPVSVRRLEMVRELIDRVNYTLPKKNRMSRMRDEPDDDLP